MVHKTSLDSSDDKVFLWPDNVNTFPLGHYAIKEHREKMKKLVLEIQSHYERKHNRENAMDEECSE